MKHVDSALSRAGGCRHSSVNFFTLHKPNVTDVIYSATSGSRLTVRVDDFSALKELTDLTHDASVWWWWWWWWCSWYSSRRWWRRWWRSVRAMRRCSTLQLRRCRASRRLRSSRLRRRTLPRLRPSLLPSSPHPAQVTYMVAQIKIPLW